MAYKVLVVDDSTFFRRRVTQILEQDPNLVVVGSARNGKDAINQVMELDPDVVTMDVEMPIMDGITAVKQIMARKPVPILMFSSLTHEGAQATLDALDAGALDFLPKKFEDIAANRKDAVDLLQSRVRALGRRKAFMPRGRTIAPSQPIKPTVLGSTVKVFKAPVAAPKPVVEEPRRILTSHKATGKRYRCLAIGTSTGGPVALQNILTKLPQNFPLPIVLVQHMPGTFTNAFAQRLNALCQISVKEAEQGDRLQPGVAYLAPGGKQMLVEGSASGAHLHISEAAAHLDVTYKPSVDLTFSSLAKVYGGDVLGVILTGMGADGREGCRELHARGARIWAQDEKSSVVYGMPQAVAAANLTSSIFSLDEMASHIITEVCH